MFFVSRVYAFKFEDYFPPAKSFPDLGSLINVIMPNILTIAGIILFIIIIIAGFQFISKAGKLEPAELQKTSGIITATIIGFIIIVAAYWLVRIIEIITGVNIFNSGL